MSAFGFPSGCPMWNCREMKLLILALTHVSRQHLVNLILVRPSSFSAVFSASKEVASEARPPFQAGLWFHQFPLSVFPTIDSCEAHQCPRSFLWVLYWPSLMDHWVTTAQQFGDRFLTQGCYRYRLQNVLSTEVWVRAALCRSLGESCCTLSWPALGSLFFCFGSKELGWDTKNTAREMLGVYQSKVKHSHRMWRRNGDEDHSGRQHSLGG